MVLPGEGGSPRGFSPNPPFSNLINLMRGNRNAGGSPSSGRGGETKSPQERYDFNFSEHFYKRNNSFPLLKR